MFETKKTKQLKKKIRELESDLKEEKDLYKVREDYIEALVNSNNEIKESRDILKKQYEDFERRTAIAETKIARIRNAIVANPDDDLKAYNEIQNIIFGNNGKHAK